MTTSEKPLPSKHSQASTVQGTLSKSVFALAIEPLNMALTVTGRKAYDVMLWIAQRSSADSEGGYTSRVSSILRGYGSSTKASERVQRYIEQMVQTAVVWRPLAASEQGTMLFEGFEPGAAQPTTDEARTFPLLAEARLFIRGGEAWVTWYYPPSIREQLVSPERWAQIELNSIARLSTYTAVALYEICARYKDSPGGITSRHEPEFWTRVLREGGGIKPREYRKFKNELLMPAIAEINELSEIAIELVEHREQASLKSLQFKVSKRAKQKDRVPEPADVTLVMRGAKLGIREEDLDALTLKYGDEKVSEALDIMDSYVSDPTASRIGNRGAYLKTVLANRFEGKEGKVVGASAPLKPAMPATSAPAIDEGQVVELWRANRLRQIKAEFSALPEDELHRWIDRATPTLLQWPMLTPAMRRRVAERDWESPLISRIVLDVYATSLYGPKWKEPSEMDLVMFRVAENRKT